MVAFGDRKDFLQFLRKVHFPRKCTLRKNCKRDAGRGSASACKRDAGRGGPAQDYCPHGFGSTSTHCPQGEYIRSRMFMTIKRLLIIIGVLFVILVGVS